METIQIKNNVFLLNTEKTSYMFRVNRYKHLEHLHYGGSCRIDDAEAFAYKKFVSHGDSTVYDKDNDVYSLDSLPQEYATYGNGDFNEASVELECGGSYTLDLRFDSFDIVKKDVAIKDLPSSYGADQTLIIHLKDKPTKIGVDLYYAVYPKENIISRRAILINRSNKDLTLHKFLSYCIDLRQEDLVSMDLFGAWDEEAHLHEQKVDRGTYFISSRVGFSSSKNNPGIILRKKDCTEDKGKAWGFNLVYSGNHYTSVSLNEYGFTRIQGGIHADRFHKTIHQGETFESPEAILTYSNQGLNQLSFQFHQFINDHIVTSKWKNKKRPILINSWEGFGFTFKKDDLIEKLAKPAKELGIELFVLDDGWFGQRSNDRAGLGDYNCNLEKIPGGISSLSKEVHDLGMLFGIWVEPEAINPDSDLYRKHPEYALQEENREPRFGRHELLMDLTNPDVRDYIVENVSKLIDENNVDYIKWDMNRMNNAVSGDYSHEYIKGLYDVLGRIFRPRPHVLFESCSSGGNRFDLGMLCYSPQIWSSDDTDAIERIEIQKGLSYFYPQSTMGAHVSACPHSQTLRDTPLQTRFAVAAYGCLGYELDLSQLTASEKEEVKAQIAYYKKYRETFQYGRFYRFEEDDEKESFEVQGKQIILSKFRRLVHTVPIYDKLYVKGVDENASYKVESRSYILNGRDFGRLFPPEMREQSFPSFVQTYKASGLALKEGIFLDPLYLGTGYEKHIRIPLDKGSDMYLITRK